MMTAQILNSELSNLIQESKRKHTDLRNAAEKSLEELKSLRSTSESQIAADLSLRSNFVTPFLIACGTKNAKFTGIAIVCLQRLVVSRALPRSRLKEVLEAFREATSSGLDVQLKILQSLPALLQNYGDDLKGELLAATLNVCSILQSSKNGIVNNTAAATLQQLVVAVFDKVVAEDKIALEVPTVAEAPIENGTIQLRAAAFDAYRVFNDLCLLTESQKPKFLKVTGLPQTFGLELIESVLTNHADIFLTHPEQANILRTRVMPFIISSLSERLSFATAVRIVRILYTLLRRHLTILAAEGEMAIGLLTHMLDPDTAPWKRALCMEVFRGLFADAGLTRQIYALYDAQSGKKAVLGDLVASFVRLSTEKPTIIGLGHESTVPRVNQYTSNGGSTDQAVLEASGIPGIISSPMGTSEANIGISTQWSSMRVPCIDQLDKTDPPSIPESYTYSLALACINSFSEGLAKFILPLTVPEDAKGRKKQLRAAEVTDIYSSEKGPDDADPRKVLARAVSFKRNPIPLNPLSLEDHPLYEEVKICAAIVDSCWPAILATCSTFLYASLDADYYHGLVRSFQKFTHVAGLLRLSTPRDAFLTTLGKAAVPSNVLKASAGPPSTVPLTPTTEHHGIFSNARDLLSVDSLGSQASSLTDRPRQPSVVESALSLNTRNLLCLRALLNLGIALGPTLDQAWLIILETLQQADYVMFSSSRGIGRSPATPISKTESQSSVDASALLVNFGTEIKAVETAAVRLFESTVDFPNQPFLEIVTALCSLFRREEEPVKDDIIPVSSLPGSPKSLRKMSHSVHRRHSISIVAPTQNQEDFFALAKVGDVASFNIDRLMAFDPDENGWNVLTKELISMMTSAVIAAPVRLRAAEILVRIVTEAASSTMTTEEGIRKNVQSRLLDTLRRSLDPLKQEGREASVSASVTDIDVHKIILEGLKSIFEQCGETLISGWDIAFEIIGSVFIHGDLNKPASQPSRPITTRSARLIRSSFNSLQLICSDFLSSLPPSCFLILVDTLYNFCTQDDDLNICLTTVTFFWVLSDFISSRTDTFSLGSDLVTSADEQGLIEKASSEDAITSNAALWMLLLLRLTVVTTDDRLELRNSAIQTLLRIFDAYGDQLSPEAWSMCIQSVIFKMFSSMLIRLDAMNSEQSLAPEKEKTSWVETTVVVLNGVAGLFATYLNVLTNHQSFTDCWRSLLEHFAALLKCNNLDINTAIFKAVTQIISQANTQVEMPAILDQESVTLVWDLWSRGLPLPSAQAVNTKPKNQACLVAYVASFKEIYRLIQEYIDVQQIQSVLGLLRTTIQQASAETYSADVEYLTALQTQVLESLKMIRTDIKGVPGSLIKQAADFSSLAFKKTSLEQSDKQLPTYVALSKASMELLESSILAHASNPEIYSSGALSAALIALSNPITLKYGFGVSIKSLAPWKQATTTSLAILKATLPVLAEADIPVSHVRTIWDSIVKIANGIMSADCTLAPQTASVATDQNFDIAAFLTLQALITPSLGNTMIPDKTRRTYTSSLFATSLIHAPATNDLPKQSQELLAVLSTPRKGRTIEPLPSPRSKMSYVCLLELFSLVSAQSSTEAEIKLAQAASPYLILRAGITLKEYISDQPLRGLMPQPLSQRRELLWILQHLVELKCETEAIPEAPGVDSEAKRHLCRLFPLISSATRVAGRDQEVREWLGKCLDEVGTEFGV